MKKIVWEVQYLSELPIYRYCKKCREKREFICSRQFRINAQRKTLDFISILRIHGPVSERVSQNPGYVRELLSPAAVYPVRQVLYRHGPEVHKRRLSEPERSS